MTRHRLVLLLLVVVGFGLLAQFYYLIPDSTGYLSWGHSLLWDGDVDFTNEYRAFGMIDGTTGIRFGSATPNGTPGNPFGMGTALLWMPFLLLSLCVSHVFHGLGQNVGTDGFSTGTLFAAHLGSWTYAIVGVLLVDAAVHRWRPMGTSNRLAVATAFLAMPLPYYVWQLPSYSHAASVCMVAAIVLLTLRGRPGATLPQAALLGVMVGVAGLVRIQNLLFAWFPLCLLYSEYRRQRTTVAGVGVFLMSCFLVFLPQLIAWRSIYGAWLQIPQGDGFVALSLSSMAHVLLSSRHGLLPTAPIVVVAGWLVLRHVTPRSRGMAVALTGCFVLQWLANAAPVDWWAGWSFGARRFCNLIPLVALALALWEGRLARASLGILMAANLVQWLRLATGHLSGEMDPGWNGLWGREFVAFLPKLPEALITILRTPWEHLSVVAQPGATLQLRADPLLLLMVLFLTWAGLLSVLVSALFRRRSSRFDAAGNSRGRQRV